MAQSTFSDLKHHSGQTVIAVILNPDHLDQSGITGGLHAGSITQERQALAVPGKV